MCVAGDGSFQMNVQEMATAANAYGVPAKVLLMNNSCLGMVHQWQKLFYEGRYSQTELERNPDFVKLADAYGWRSERVERPATSTRPSSACSPQTGPICSKSSCPASRTSTRWWLRGRPSDSLGAIDLAVGAVRVDMPRSRDAARQAVGGVSPAACSLGADDVVGEGEPMKHVLSALVANESGVLSRITGSYPAVGSTSSRLPSARLRTPPYRVSPPSFMPTTWLTSRLPSSCTS